MGKRMLNWSMEDAKATVSFESGEKAVFDYSDIIGWKKPESIVVMELFKHGLKQKLADCVAGAAKKGYTPKEQIEAIQKTWDAVKNGNMTTRQAAPKITAERFAEITAEIPEDASPELKALLDAIRKKMVK